MRDTSPDSSNLVARLTRWFIFSVVIALLPIWFSLYPWFFDGGDLLTLLIASCAHGEPLLLTAAISGSALGALIVSGRGLLITKRVAGGGCIIVLVLASVGFAYLTGDRSVSMTSEAIAFGSLAMLAFGIVCSGSCIALIK